jgi:hypothetical protein
MYNKRERNLKGKSKLDSLETLATLFTQDTGGRQTHHNTTQKPKKDEYHEPHLKPRVNSGAREW